MFKITLKNPLNFRRVVEICQSAMVVFQYLLTKGLLMNKCSSCGQDTTQFITDDGEYYYPMCGECY